MFHTVLKQLNYLQAKTHHCIYFERKNNSLLIIEVLVYVDDLLVASDE